MDANQCRAARGLLHWTQEQLSEAAQVGIATIRKFENDNVEPRRATIAALQRALENAGVAFIGENGGGSGVRMKEPRGRSKE